MSGEKLGTFGFCSSASIVDKLKESAVIRILARGDSMSLCTNELRILLILLSLLVSERIFCSCPDRGCNNIVPGSCLWIRRLFRTPHAALGTAVDPASCADMFS